MFSCFKPNRIEALVEKIREILDNNRENIGFNVKYFLAKPEVYLLLRHFIDSFISKKASPRQKKEKLDFIRRELEKHHFIDHFGSVMMDIYDLAEKHYCSLHGVALLSKKHKSDNLEFEDDFLNTTNTEDFYGHLIKIKMGTSDLSYFSFLNQKKSNEDIYRCYIPLFEYLSGLFKKMPLPDSQLVIIRDDEFLHETFANNIPYLVQKHKVPLPLAVAVSFGSYPLKDADVVADLLKHPYISMNFAICIGGFSIASYEQGAKQIASAKQLLSECEKIFGSDSLSARGFLNDQFSASGYKYLFDPTDIGIDIRLAREALSSMQHKKTADGHSEPLESKPTRPFKGKY